MKEERDLEGHPGHLRERVWQFGCGEGTTVKMERCECIQGKFRIQKNKSER